MLGVVGTVGRVATRSVLVLIPVLPEGVGILPVLVEIAAVAGRITVVAGIFPVGVIHVVGVDAVIVEAELFVFVAIIDDQVCLVFGFSVAHIVVHVGMTRHEDKGDRFFALSGAAAYFASAGAIFRDQRVHPLEIVVRDMVSGDVAPRPHHHVDLCVLRVVEIVAGGLDKSGLVAAQVRSIFAGCRIGGQSVVMKIEFAGGGVVVGDPEKDIVARFVIGQTEKTAGDVGAMGGMLVSDVECCTRLVDV